MLSSVFMMQPIGQALAQLVGLWVLLGFEDMKNLRELRCGLDLKNEEKCKEAVDGIWRIVIGSGAAPALLAIIFRFFLYDCGLYTLEVRNKPEIAIEDTQRVYGQPSDPATGFRFTPQGAEAPNINGHPPVPHSHSPPAATSRFTRDDSLPNGDAQDDSSRSSPVQFSKQDLYNYFIRDGNWSYLLGTSATWFFLDVSFYGLSLDNRLTLSDMWATTDPTKIDERLECWNSSLDGGTSTVPSWVNDGLPVWQTDATHPCNTIYDVLIEQTKQYLLTVSLASIAGSACFVLCANRIPRRHWLTASFLVLALMFMITGAVFYAVHRELAAPATVVFVAFCHFLFNFGRSLYASASRTEESQKW